MSRRVWRSSLILPALLAGSLLLAVGCGEEQAFEADEFVREVNDEGVELELGEELTTEEPGATLYAVELAPLKGAPPVPGEGPVGGSLAVYDDEGAAEDRFATCEAAADLLCYRAANVVVILERGGIEAQRLGAAIQRLAE
jgi:hypothetical protein